MGMAIDSAVPDDEGQGCALAESGDYKGAVEHFRRAAASGQGTAEVHEMLAQCLLETGAHEEALEAASSAVRLRPEVLPGFRNRLRKQHRQELTGLDCMGQWWTAHLTLARAQRNCGTLQAALQSLTSALQVITCPLCLLFDWPMASCACTTRHACCRTLAGRACLQMTRQKCDRSWTRPQPCCSSSGLRVWDFPSCESARGLVRPLFACSVIVRLEGRLFHERELVALQAREPGQAAWCGRPA